MTTSAVFVVQIHVNLVADTSPKYIYIDGTDAAKEGTFVSSVTGAALEHIRWSGGEPNNWDNEDCLNILSDTGLMNDMKCSEPLPSVCERREYSFDFHVIKAVCYNAVQITAQCSFDEYYGTLAAFHSTLYFNGSFFHCKSSSLFFF